MVSTSSADVRISTFGHIAAAWRMEPVMRSAMTRAGVSSVFHPMGNTASQRKVTETYSRLIVTGIHKSMWCSNVINCFFFFCSLEAAQVYEYILEVEISVSDITLIERLKDAVENISFPVRLNNTINITQIDIIFPGKNIIACPVICMRLF